MMNSYRQHGVGDCFLAVEQRDSDGNVVSPYLPGHCRQRDVGLLLRARRRLEDLWIQQHLPLLSPRTIHSLIGAILAVARLTKNFKTFS